MSAVLIVDDSPTDRALLRTVLARAGFEVRETPSGRDVAEQARDWRPHAIILDVNLPGADGHAVCRALKADPQLAGIPVLMLTVRDHEADILAGLEAGADDYIVKDAPAEILVARVRRLAGYRRMALLTALNEQLAQVGRLLTGIVHEIRAPLSVIRGNAELLKLKLGEGPAAGPHVEPIIRNCQILQVRLEHLMATVRGGPAILRPMEVAPLVQEATALYFKGTDGAGRLRLVTELAPDLPPVRGDAGRLIQVLMNLLGNAAEAIRGAGREGRIVVRAGRGVDGGRGGVRLEVLDDGPGIPEAHLGRIFEPFFTTKETGSGYGLYLASEILKEHAGRLEACNLPEGGACFALWLPEAEDRGAAGPAGA